MNFQGLKTEFINYLKDLNAKEGKHYVVDKGDVSIFMYANEFKDYLKNSDIDCSDVSIFSKSVNELLSMDIKNGKLIDSIDSDSKTEEQNDTEDKTIDDEDFMKDLLTDLMNDNDFKGMLDADESGEVDDAELKNFFNSIKGNDSDENNVSLSDIIQAVTEIENGTFTIENETNSEDIEKTSEEDKKSNETETKNSANTSGATGAGGGGSVGSSGGVSSGGGGLSAAGGNSATGNVVDPNDINNMSLEQLEQEKTTREGAVSDAREAVNDVYSGDNANVAAAQKDYEDAKEDYEEALEDDDKVSDELKEQHEQVISDIENAESEKDSINIKINDTEAKISNVESEISADEANIEALNVSLAALQDSNSEDAASKIAEVQAQISAAEAQKTAHEEEKANLESELDSLQDELSDKENEIEELESQRSDIEDEILKNCSKETKKALETFNKAKENVTSVKESELKTVQADLKVAEADLKEINDVINTKKAEDTKTKYNPKITEGAVDWARQFDDYSQDQMQAIFEQYGHEFHYGGWCADFVKMCLYEGVGEENLPEWYVNCPAKAHPPTVQQYANGHEVNINEARAGDVILYDWDGDGSADHVGIYVDSGDGATTITTIEGNTYGAAGTSCVEEKERPRNGQILGIYSIH